MAKKLAQPRPNPFALTNALALTRFGTDDLRRHIHALTAIKQLLDVPIPEEATAAAPDNGSLQHVWRDDLAALLELIIKALDESTHFTATQAQIAIDFFHHEGVTP
jgi:hypothetical protein